MELILTISEQEIFDSENWNHEKYKNSSLLYCRAHRPLLCPETAADSLVCIQATICKYFQSGSSSIQMMEHPSVVLETIARKRNLDMHSISSLRSSIWTKRIL